MRKKIWMLMFAMIISILSACSNGKGNDQQQVIEEPKPLEVEFIVPEKADVGEKIQLKAMVTYGEEKVNDANEVKFEYWEKGNQEDSTMIEGNNNGDGTYTAEVSFDRDGVFEMYAHTTARDLHTMPKKSITIGQGASPAHEDGHQGHEHSGHSEGFAMNFMKPGDIKVNQEKQLTVHLQLNNEPLKNAKVRYEIFNENSADKHAWVETEELASGEYTSSYVFEESGAYTIIIHVENDEGLHEHEEHKVEVTK